MNLDKLVSCILEAWNGQNVEEVLDCYTEDLRYRDPNTRGEIRGQDAMRRYLTKLFSIWQMSWAPREVFALENDPGVAFLWHATFRRKAGSHIVEADGMDLALIRGERLARNEVYFDPSLLHQLRPPED